MSDYCVLVTNADTQQLCILPAAIFLQYRISGSAVTAFKVTGPTVWNCLMNFVRT